MAGKKRPREEDGGGGEAGPSTSGRDSEATIGQKTAHIKNKLVRSEK